MRRWILSAALAGLVVFLLLQVVPYGWWHENPPVVTDAPWPAADLARGACYDCHSNETEWPAYSYVAPMSWLVRRDVEAGRDALNFSRWDEVAADEAEDAAETTLDGEMPPAQYERLHPDSRLSDQEAAVLVAALEALAGAGEGSECDNSGPGNCEEGGEGD